MLDLRVTAVVVAHNGARYLPTTLDALAGQSRPVDFSVGVDTGSTDDSASILQLGLPVGAPVVGSPARAGFGAAVRTAVAQIPQRKAAAEGTENQDWLWLLHDDSAPGPTALEELLLAVERAPSVTVAGTKQVHWDNPRELLDVGLSISRWAERLTLIDVDEHDQGQYDARSDTFAVNSAGMLIRRDVWDALGGFDPALPGVGDDIDFCWRNRLAGHRVVVVPAAVMRHASSRGTGPVGSRAARRAEVFLRLKHAPLWQVPFLAIGAVLGGVGRLLLGLLAKDPAHGTGQLLASLAAALRPVVLTRARRGARRTRRLPRGVVRPLLTPRREVWAHRRSVLEAFTARGAVAGGGGTGAVPEQDVPAGDSNDDFAALAAPGRAWVGAGALAAAAVLLGVSLLALRSWIGAPSLAGGALLPLPPTPGEIWEKASAWWVPLGSGAPGHGSPFSYLLWALSALGLGNPNAALVTIHLLALPLAGLAAWFAAGALTRSRGLRLWAAFFWAAVPALQVALGSGRLGALLAHLLLPLVLLGLVRAVGAAASAPSATGEVRLRPGTNGTPSWTAAAAAGLLLAAVTSAAPSLLPAAVLGIAGACLILRRRARTLWWSLLPPLVLALPVALSVGLEPRGLLGDPGVPLQFSAAAAWQQVLGYPVSFDALAAPAGVPAAGPWALVAALVVGAPAVLLAAGALFSGRRRPAALSAWAVALLVLASSAASAHLPVAAGPTSLIPPFPGPMVSAFSLAVLAAALLGADRFTSSMPATGGRRRGVRPLLVAGAVVLALGPVVSLGLWTLPHVLTTPASGTAAPASAGAATAANGTADTSSDGRAAASSTRFGTDVQISASPARTLPATAADRGNGPDRTRTLVLRRTEEGAIDAALVRGGGTTLDALSPLYAARAVQGSPGAADVRGDDDATATLRTSVAAITGGTGIDPREDLRTLGVGYVVLRQSGTAAELLAGQLDSVPGLAAVGSTPSGWLWRVVPPATPAGVEDAGAQTARVRILDASGNAEALVRSGPLTVDADIPSGSEGRTLVLAERADPGWKATLNGRVLDSQSTGWAQTFALPAAGGELEVRFVSPWQPWVEAGQAAVLLITLLLALPLPTRLKLSRLPAAARPEHGRPPAPSGPRRGGRSPEEPMRHRSGSLHTGADRGGDQHGTGPGLVGSNPGKTKA
ncbi:glycosyltransferase family 2 protein [Arthrobacter crusticola]|uniref:Glycosyltransferase family 2 protein n=1 Tax=Arthrobacter crusticola TaxID=2547960 RepID=A0A4R5TZW4_9MICC|nr:glycosyltransferase family 2 protein [Arthrobacter crusticola]TDK26800.1 glycosyltransferase family 2 protein [Arthrobacter crusticola]